MEGTAVGETAQVAQFGGDQRPDNQADIRNSFNRVSHRGKELLDVKIELGELFFEELQLCDHGVDDQIQRAFSDQNRDKQITVSGWPTLPRDPEPVYPSKLSCLTRLAFRP